MRATTLIQTGTSTGSETRFLAVDGGQTAYDDMGGDGPLIPAIPGLGDLRSEYRLLRPELQGAGYRVVTMDVRGFGETSARWDDYSAHAVGRGALASGPNVSRIVISNQNALHFIYSVS